MKLINFEEVLYCSESGKLLYPIGELQLAQICVFLLSPTEVKSIGMTHAETVELLRSARVITAIKTPYKSNGKFDLEAYDRMVALQIDNGANGLIIGGTTGEGHLMSWDEHIMLIAHTAKEFGKQILVIGNTGGLTCN